jgi:tRNA nucleotidyltransferase (CCA-adding enzyme)
MRAAAGRAAGGLRGSYPQVEPAAGELARARVAVAPPEVTVADALRLARRRDAAVLAVGRAWVLREDLARASWLGFDRLPARAVARSLPVVPATGSEIVVRRRFAEGAPAVVVLDPGRGPQGAVMAPERGGPSGASLGPRFPDRLPPATRAALAALRRVAGARVFLVGGVVREALRTREAITTPDLDVVVEGDALRVARALAGAVGAAPGRGLVEHVRFLTASVTTAAGARVDLATARSERYEAPGALPRVVPAAIGQDLGRRDFTVNAMAVDLTTDAFDVVDPYGGRWALARRQLSVLHPLAFVEDPTRIFRAARYATRLGFAPDAWTTRALRLGLACAPYPALSGQRLLAELALVAREARAAPALAWLGAAGAFRLLAPDYRWTVAARRAVARLPGALDWARRSGLAPEPVEAVLVAVLAGQRAAVPAAALDRLALRGEPRSRIERALAAGRTRPAPGARPSERARPWRGQSDLELFAAALLGDETVKREVAWFVAEARAVRPTLRGEDVVALGAAPGPEVARILAALRDARLDGAVVERDDERALVRNWLQRKEA